jgi:hypothetical protein
MPEEAERLAREIGVLEWNDLPLMLRGSDDRD